MVTTEELEKELQNRANLLIIIAQYKGNQREEGRVSSTFKWWGGWHACLGALVEAKRKMWRV